MPHHEQTRLSATVGDIFAHRFVLQTSQGNVLADLGPWCAEAFLLTTGAHVHIVGERKPSEIKVRTIALEGGKAVTTDHPAPPYERDQNHVDPRMAVQAAEKAGFIVMGKPRRRLLAWRPEADTPSGV